MAIPFSVVRIDHVVFRVRDLERSIAFYGDVVGCRVLRRRDELGLVHLEAGSTLIDLVAVDGPLGSRGGAPAGDKARNVDHLCLRIEPYDEAEIVRHLADHDIEPTAIAQANLGAEGVGPSLYFNDPDGNSIELKGPSQQVDG